MNAENPLAAVAAAIRRGHQALTELMVERIRADVMEYREAATPELIDQLTTNVEGHLDVYCEILERGSQLASEQRFTFALDAARTRAAQGVSSESLIRSFSSASLAIWTWLVNNDWTSPEKSPVLAEAWPLWLSYINEASARVSVVYREVEMQSFADESAARAHLVEGLVDGRMSLGVAHRQLIRFGMEPGKPLVLIVLTRSVAEDESETAIFDSVQQIARLVEARVGALTRARPLMAIRGEQALLLAGLSGSSTEQVRAVVARAVDAAASSAGVFSGIVSRSVLDVLEVQDAYASCSRAARVVAGSPRVIHVTDLGILDYATHALGADIRFVCPPKIARFVSDAPQDHPDWIETIEAWVSNNMNVKQTAASMHVHVNTVYYRLSQISKATDIDTNNLEDIVGLLIASRLRTQKP